MFDRRQIKAEARSLTRSAQVSAFAVTGVLLALLLAMRMVDTLVSGNTYESLFAAGLPGIFVNILVGLIALVMEVGFFQYCLAVRQGTRAELLTLFDGFSFVGKIILLTIQQAFFIYLWSMLFVIPGIVAAYRYRFAFFNLCENPDLSPSEAIRMSKVQTNGAKMELFLLDLSFFGWLFLSFLPYGVLNALAFNGIDIPLPALAVTLLCGVLSSLVDLWRMPYQTLSELRYFDICKQASGVGAGINGPDAPLPLGDGDDQTRSF